MLSLRPLGYVAVLSIVSVGCGGQGEGFKETETATLPLPRSTSSSATLTCKKAGCSDRFTVRLKQRPSDPKGWAVEVDLKGKPATCTFDWSPTTTSATCGEGLSMAFHEPPLDDATTATLTVAGAPSRVGLTVKHNGAPIEPQRFYDPTYETDPTGTACGCQASGTFVLK
jgi:hypothetical protein